MKVDFKDVSTQTVKNIFTKADKMGDNNGVVSEEEFNKYVNAGGYFSTNLNQENALNRKELADASSLTSFFQNGRIVTHLEDGDSGYNRGSWPFGPSESDNKRAHNISDPFEIIAHYDDSTNNEISLADIDTLAAKDGNPDSISGIDVYNC